MHNRRHKILIGPSSFGEHDASLLQRLQERGCEIIRNPFGRKLAKSELLDFLNQGVTGLIAGLETLDREVLARSSLKVISRCGSGIANIDLAAAREMLIKVFSTPLAPVQAVAELTVGCLLALLRRLPWVNQTVHERKWVKDTGVQLAGKTVAVVGYGHIGERVGKMLHALGAQIVAVDPYRTQDFDGVPTLEINKALPIADIITLHASGTGVLLNAAEFQQMKQGVFLLNAARGELINEAALLSALDCAKVRGVWLDTFLQEPYSGSLCGHPRAILTPHIGSYTIECRRSMESEAVDNLLREFECAPSN